MYNSFFNLQCKPFENTPDAGFLWLGEKHREALAALRYGILENKGFVLLTGIPGSGKTTLVNALIASLDQGVLAAVLTDPSRERLDFYNAIAAGFGLDKEFTSKVQFLIQFSQFLHKAHDDGKKVLLVIDDCQRLSQEMIEELRLLSNIEKADAKLINTFFVGEREFNDTLIQPNNRAMRQRLTVKVDLPSLTLSESENYIRHRLQVAGSNESLFSAKALQVIHQYANGVPKRINIICDQAMAAGCVQGKRHLDHKIVEECVQKLNLPYKPPSAALAVAEEEKSLGEHRRDSLQPGGKSGAIGGSGINLTPAGRFTLIKSVVAGLAVAGIAFAFWYHGVRTTPVALEGPVEKQQMGGKTSPSLPPAPAVAVVEPKASESGGKIATERKSAIAENTSGNGDGGQVSSGVDSAPTSPGEAPVIASPNQPPANSAGGSVAAGKLSVPPSAVEKEESVAAPTTPPPVPLAKPPALPEKVTLPLAANSLKLTPEGNAELRALLAKLAAAPGSRLLVKGFVSSSTASPANTKLSEERAAAVQKLLVAGGIEAGRIEVKGMGIEEPIATNDTPEGRTKNRRVEIVILEGGTR